MPYPMPDPDEEIKLVFSEKGAQKGGTYIAQTPDGEIEYTNLERADVGNEDGGIGYVWNDKTTVWTGKRKDYSLLRAGREPAHTKDELRPEPNIPTLCKNLPLDSTPTEEKPFKNFEMK